MQGLEAVAALPDPVGEIIESSVRPNGLDIQKVRVPLGVVFFIYESRPNVTVDTVSLAWKTGNAAVLRGGKEAVQSNQKLVAILSAVLGIAGSFIAGFIGSLVHRGSGEGFHPAGFIYSILGAIILIFLARSVFHLV